MIVAEYTAKTKSRFSELAIRHIVGGHRQPEIAVYLGVTKTEARKLAAVHDATPWNF